MEKEIPPNSKLRVTHSLLRILNLNAIKSPFTPIDRRRSRWEKGAFPVNGVSIRRRKTVAHRLGYRRLLSALPCMLFAGTVLIGCSRQTGDEIAQRHLRDIAGKEAADCGHVGLHQSPVAANDCALAAWKIHSSFLVRYDVQGLDSELVV